MAILGIGTDIVSVERFKAIAAKERFIRRVFTPAEIAYCNSQPVPARHFAARFAAKEAAIKAMAAGGISLTITQAEVLRRGATGVPTLRLIPGANRSGLPPLPAGLTLHVSLAHDGDYATAMVVAEITGI